MYHLSIQQHRDFSCLISRTALILLVIAVIQVNGEWDDNDDFKKKEDTTKDTWRGFFLLLFMIVGTVGACVGCYCRFCRESNRFYGQPVSFVEHGVYIPDSMVAAQCMPEGQTARQHGSMGGLGQNYSQPQQCYGQQQNYGQAQENFGQPQQNYDRPQQDFGKPQHYGQLHQYYDQSQQNYGHPQQNFCKPQHYYGQLQHNYSQPQQQDFGKP